MGATPSVTGAPGLIHRSQHMTRVWTRCTVPVGLCWRIGPSWSVWHRPVLQGVDGPMGMVPGVCDVVASEWVHGDPAGTSRVARAAFPNGCLVARVRDALGPLFAGEQFSELFAAGAAGVVAGAAGAGAGTGSSSRASPVGRPPTRCELGWAGTCALGLDLRDPGFAASAPSEFRARLLPGGQAERLPGLMVARLRGRGRLQGDGRRRTDATHVPMAVRDLHRLQAGHRAPPRRIVGPWRRLVGTACCCWGGLWPGRAGRAGRRGGGGDVAGELDPAVGP